MLAKKAPNRPLIILGEKDAPPDLARTSSTMRKAKKPVFHIISASTSDGFNYLETPLE